MQRAQGKGSLQSALLPQVPKTRWWLGKGASLWSSVAAAAGMWLDLQHSDHYVSWDQLLPAATRSIYFDL